MVKVKAKIHVEAYLSPFPAGVKLPGGCPPHGHGEARLHCSVALYPLTLTLRRWVLRAGFSRQDEMGQGRNTPSQRSPASLVGPSFLLLAHMQKLSSAATMETRTESNHGPDYSSITIKGRMDFIELAVHAMVSFAHLNGEI